MDKSDTFYLKTAVLGKWDVDDISFIIIINLSHLHDFSLIIITSRGMLARQNVLFDLFHFIDVYIEQASW